jgi:hypothetical protein
LNPDDLTPEEAPMSDPDAFLAAPPPPSSDDDTFEVIDEALAALAARRGLWLGDQHVTIHLLASLIAQAERCLPTEVTIARDNGTTWTQIAQLLGTSPHEAQLRFDPDSPVADGSRPNDH